MLAVNNADQRIHSSEQVRRLRHRRLVAREAGALLPRALNAVVITAHGMGKVIVAAPHAELSVGDGSVETPQLLQFLRGFLTHVAPAQA